MECHALLSSPKVSRLLERAQASASQLEDWQLANLREMRRERDHAIAMPMSLVSRLAKATSLAEVRWIEAKEARNFAILAPQLEEVLALTRDRAAVRLPGARPVALRCARRRVQPGLPERRDRPAVPRGRAPPAGSDPRAIEAQAATPPLPLGARVGVAKQRQLALEVMKAVGFPFDRGRLDESEHPFTEGVPGDVRVTTRVRHRQRPVQQDRTAALAALRPVPARPMSTRFSAPHSTHRTTAFGPSIFAFAMLPFPPPVEPAAFSNYIPSQL